MKHLYIILLMIITALATFAVTEVLDHDAEKNEHSHNEAPEKEKPMNFEIPKEIKTVENLGYITVGGEKTELSGTQLKVGDTLTDVTLDKKADYFDQVETTSLADFKGYKIIETVPSLDTPVCTIQTKQLEFAAEKYPEITFLVVSNDTPFALQRFCAANKIDNLQVVSDARSREFGTKNALLMKKYGLLTRSIMIVDENNTVQYIEYANEVTQELDLMNALAKLNELLKEEK